MILKCFYAAVGKGQQINGRMEVYLSFGEQTCSSLLPELANKRHSGGVDSEVLMIH